MTQHQQQLSRADLTQAHLPQVLNQYNVLVSCYIHGIVCVCMYVCMYVLYVYMYVCMYVCMCVYVCMYV